MVFGMTLLCNATQAKLRPLDDDGFTLDVADCDHLLAIIDASSMLKLLVISSEKKETAELSHKHCLQTTFCNLASIVLQGWLPFCDSVARYAALE